VLKNCTLRSTSVTGDVTIRHQNWNHATHPYTQLYNMVVVVGGGGEILKQKKIEISKKIV
jgi:hypothetical protein